MSIFSRFIFLSLFFLQIFAESRVPKEARKVLQSLPDQKLTLEVVIKGAMGSDGFKMIQSQGIQKEVFRLSRKSLLDPTFSGQIIQGDDQSAATRPGSAYSLKSLTGNLSLSKMFSTGTVMSLQSNYQDIDSSATSFVGQGPDVVTKYFENKLVFNLRQNFLRDSFGYATRKSLQSLKVQEKNVINDVSLAMEDWGYGLMQVFYNAWFSQQRVIVEKSNYQRQKRLLKITSLKVRRGTAERPDLLQVRSAEKNANEKLKGARQDMENVWRQLVITLNFPMDWMDIDPLLIPMKLDNPVPEAEKACRVVNDGSSNLEIVSLKNKLKASELSLSAAKNKMWPDLYMGLRVTSNGVDSAQSDVAFENSLKNENQGIFVEMGVSIPLGNYKAKSELAQSAMNETLSRLRFSSAKSAFQVNWRNECLNLKRLQKKRREMRSVAKMQKERSRLEEKRFRIGQIPVFNMIQAGNDAALAQLALKQSEMEVRLSSWKILKLQGKLAGYLQQISGVSQ